MNILQQEEIILYNNGNLWLIILQPLYFTALTHLIINSISYWSRRNLGQILSSDCQSFNSTLEMHKKLDRVCSEVFST